jgi:hypothetical protein
VKYSRHAEQRRIENDFSKNYVKRITKTGTCVPSYRGGKKYWKIRGKGDDAGVVVILSICKKNVITTFLDDDFDGFVSGRPKREW